ncbi:MAG TPA: hypothetical protein VF472_11090 [Burkholderiaceae bacterium]
MGGQKGTKRERAEYIRKRSLEMAQSGEHTDWQSIEHALRMEGLSEARQQLDSKTVRAELNDLCQQARQKS